MKRAASRPLIHLVFGMADDFGGKPWSWFHHMAVVTAAAVNDPQDILFWHEYEPTGQWWDASRPYLTLRKIDAPREVFGRPLVHPAHRADVVRLMALIECGGVYIDSDVWCLRPFSGIRHKGFWMGHQGVSYGLCNATMGGDARSTFAAEWMRSYETFRSKGRDRYWDEHSVRLPLQLAKAMPAAITVLPRDWFFSPLWGKLPEIFQPPGKRRHRRHLDASYSAHLWESICWNFLSKLGPDTVHPDSEIGKRLTDMGVL